MNPGLYIVGTPIGNLEDISQRALAVLKAADLIVAEDTRHSGFLLSHYGIRKPILSCHKFNEQSRTHVVMDRIKSGAAVALVTDSGMPGVSDPGSRMVRVCREQGLYVTAIPGPTAATTAVALSGFGGRGFLFEGFLDHRDAARRKRLAELAAQELPLVLYESPYRLIKLMAAIEEVMGPRLVFVGREMTKKFEESTWGTPAEIRAAFEGRAVKGEIVVVVCPA